MLLSTVKVICTIHKSYTEKERHNSDATINPFTAILAMPSLGNRTLKSPNLKPLSWGHAAFQRFVSTDVKHYIFCLSDTKNA